MITRKDYMAKRATHREYYGQFVTPRVVASVSRIIGRDRILASTDPHLNDIPLHLWETLPWSGALSAVSEANGTGGVSLSDRVCVMKEAARQIQEGA